MPTIGSDWFPIEGQNEASSKKSIVQTETWNQDQTYDGEYFRGIMHGQGEYKWNKRGAYDGGFYSGSKNGYGVVSLPDNSTFEGLFVLNQPFGPGILTNPNGRQDVGFWVGRKLVRLSRTIDYVVPRLAPSSVGKVKLLKYRRLISLSEDEFDSVDDILNGWRRPFEHFCQNIHDPRSILFDKASFEKAYFEPLIHEQQESETQYFCQSESFRCPTFLEDEYSDTCDQWEESKEHEKGLLGNLTEIKQIENESTPSSFPGENVEANTEKLFPSKLISWNRSELCTNMLKQIFRHRDFEEKIHFAVGKVMLGERTAFRKTGKTENQCLNFLRTCFSGSASAVKQQLCDKEISSDLMDGRGNNSLMFAAAMDQRDIIDVLLDYGVDVNSFNDENLTPLNLCLLRRLAEVYQISDWETAFLPPGSSDSPDSNEVEWRATESFRSLDRLFGDGNSISDYENFLKEQKSESTKKETSDSKVFSMKESPHNKSGSQMTVMRMKKNFNENVKASTLSIYDSSMVYTNESSGFKIKSKLKESNTGLGSPTGYLFQLSPGNRFIAADGKPPNSMLTLETSYDSKITEKIKEIDKTIEKLLQRGADPNLTEVPKPSIHLGLFTKDTNIVRNLLFYGANPNRRLSFSEGFLTPLHVIALMPPAPEYVDICKLLLTFGASPEEETAPEFVLYNEEDKNRLNIFQGRTPLQLICMRPDLERDDPLGLMTKIALTLGRVSNKNHFLNGHSYLTLTMLCGNVSLLKALLNSKFFDPNQILGDNKGSALEVLVSTSFQQKTLYDSSIQMKPEGQEIPLIDRKTYRIKVATISPSISVNERAQTIECEIMNAVGRWIPIALEKRADVAWWNSELEGTSCDLLLAAGADPLKKIESLGRNSFEFGYEEIEKEKARRKLSDLNKKEISNSKANKNEARDHLTDHIRVMEYLEQTSGKKKKHPRSPLKNMKRTEEDSGEFEQDEGFDTRLLPKKTGIEKKSNKKNTTRLRTSQLEADNLKHKGSNSKRKALKTKLNNAEKNLERESERNAIRKRPGISKQRQKDKNKKNVSNVGVKKEDKKKSKRKVSVDANHPKKRKTSKIKSPKINTPKIKRPKIKTSNIYGKKKSIEGQQVKDKKQQERQIRGEYSSINRLASSHSAMLPKNLRQPIQRMFGNCMGLYASDFYLPYVVFRNGDLYYRFKGKTTDRKEQYSLI